MASGKPLIVADVLRRQMPSIQVPISAGTAQVESHD